MKRALSSFAIIKNSFDEGEDYIGAFVPLLIRLFFIKNYTSVVIESICKDFEAEYGIRIPLHPMETILNRMKPIWCHMSPWFSGKAAIIETG